MSAVFSLTIALLAPGCAKPVLLHNAFPPPADNGRTAGVLLPVEDRSSHGRFVGTIDPPLPQLFAEALRKKLAEGGMPVVSIAAAASPAEAHVLADGEFILDVHITKFAISMGSVGSMEVEYGVYAPGNPRPIAAWTLTTSRHFVNAAGVATITSATISDTVKRMIDDAATGVSPEHPGGNAAAITALSDQLELSAQKKLNERVDSLVAAGDANGALQSLAAAARTCPHGAAWNALFSRIVTLLPTLPAPPPLAEEGRRFVVQAEDAAKEGRYGEAINFYDRAIGVSPWWPNAYYNAALLLAEQSQFALAAQAMTAYVALVPAGPQTRKAQDQIYLWQGKAAAGR